MERLLKIDPWKIIEEGFEKKYQRDSESIFSLGNGRMGQRACFEEDYSGDHLMGSYIAGIYYPDKTKVGWWKNGYPEYFAKIINSPNWIRISVKIDNEKLDLAKWKVEEFSRTLNMRIGTLSRSFIATSKNGKKIRVHTVRFLSMNNPDLGAIQYNLEPLNFSGKISFEPSIDADVKNEDSNYDEKFWTVIENKSEKDHCYLLAETNKLDFKVGYAMKCNLHVNGEPSKVTPDQLKENNLTGQKYSIDLTQNQVVTLNKYVSVISNLNHPAENVFDKAIQLVSEGYDMGFEKLLQLHEKVWESIWSHSDIEIEGDTKAQQGIRFNIFHLNQTYRGDDPRLNVGPKGFTGEKYGGLTYWDTEAYCVPFFLGTASDDVTKNLLLYRYKHLQKAIENAEKLGFSNGAALYPMVTINGEECHNEWEITFEEIHRNGAIAFAIHKYIQYTGNIDYLTDYGLEVLIAISRFWEQRVSLSPEKEKYVILGVTGPNEYENNVNNNWYTNKIAAWCLEYTLDAIGYVKNNHPDKYLQLVNKLEFNADVETKKWEHIITNMYYPYSKKDDVFLQQDGYLDKPQCKADDLDPGQRPINQNWSWDRILRSCFIKQADVLQGIYFLEDSYNTDTIKRNFDFYEPRTVHESSLSPCIHSILASKIGYIDKAYDLYLRTSRLDLDDYNREVHEGLHITSMAGTWMSIVEGFGGFRVRNSKACFSPIIPEQWISYSFKVRFRGTDIKVSVSKSKLIFKNTQEVPVNISIYNNDYKLEPYEEKEIEHEIIPSN